MSAPRPVMLSFDDGPLPGLTDRVLDTLAAYRGEDGQPLRAGFFMVGDAPPNFWPARRYYAPYELWIHKGSMRRFPALVQQVIERGHEIGNHSLHHLWGRWPRFRSVAAVRAEIDGWTAVATAAGWSPTAPRWFRAPYLIDTPAMRAAVAQAGYHWVGGDTLGDAAPRRRLADWIQTFERLAAQPGGDPIMLILHDILPGTVDRLGDLLDAIAVRGHPFWHFAPRIG
ncbi:polysaccharide deacetylase family protein [Halothiobacillus sp. DCM-1]|uniref:polysaccharide deacetylase family protein n=1 Tax=Halothiobacillus sp. DCM-1 TaxID=3112558 RepID=UPI00325391C1